MKRSKRRAFPFGMLTVVLLSTVRLFTQDTPIGWDFSR